MPVSLSPVSFFSAETFERAARAVAGAWEEEEEGAVRVEEEEQRGEERSSAAVDVVSWRWVPSASRFAASLGGGYLEALSRSHRGGENERDDEEEGMSLLPGVLLPLAGGKPERAEEEGEEEEAEEAEDDDEKDEATLPRRAPSEDGRVSSPAMLRVELHVCFGASFRAPRRLKIP